MRSQLQVKLPDGYHFGVSASSAENPDSFEIFKFAVSTTNSNTREEPGGNSRFPPKQQQQQQRYEQPPAKQASSQTIHDVLASTIKSRDDQFEDLHNRIQDMSHHVNAIYEHLEYLESFQAKRHTEVMERLASIEDRTGHTVRTLENIERSTNSILRDVESKDFKDLLNQVHHAISSGHETLSNDIPAVMKKIVVSHSPSWIMFLCIAVAVQVMITGAYLVYKKRRNGAPKKYL
jgi:mannose-binding lectin 1